MSGRRVRREGNPRRDGSRDPRDTLASALLTLPCLPTTLWQPVGGHRYEAVQSFDLPQDVGVLEVLPGYELPWEGTP